MRKLYVYAHTHWDREWYQPFETFRLQLVKVVREILDELESGTLPRFYLDGQSIIFEDVLEVAPELRPRLEANMRSGRLSAGPWYVLADQMLVGGESLIRNLATGMRDTSRFGNPAMVGYCPDTFGHSQDLPRILAGFGIKNAVVWRGVPLLQMGPLFWWSSPDGSRVLTYHLTHGYYQTGFHECAEADTAGGGNGAVDKLADRLLPWVALADSNNGVPSSYYKPLDGALMPVGADHVGPPPMFSQLLKQLNARYQRNGTKLGVVPTTLSEFIDIVSQRAQKGMNVIWSFDGELRSNRAAPYYERAYLLYGVLSTRLYLKRLNRLAELKLSGVVEPVLSVLRANGMAAYPETELDYAWRLLMKNHPHDSICGCSVDSVHDEMVTRYSRLDQLCNGLLQQASRRLCSTGMPAEDPDSGCGAWLAVNCGLHTASQPVAVRWFEPLQKRSAASGTLQIEGRTKVDQLFSGFGIVPYYKEVECVEGFLWVDSVPGLGARVLDSSHPADVPQPAVARSHRLSNGLLEVSVSSAGRLSVNELNADGSFQTFKISHQLIDVGDAGDSYNFDPILDDKPVAARFVDASVQRKGPLVASLLLTYEIDLPEKAVEETGFISRTRIADLGKIELRKRSAKRLKHLITTEVTLKAGVPIVFFETEFDNRARDHRLRVMFDTEHVVQDTFSENHFSMVHRVHGPRRKAEKLPVETACEALPDAFPCQRFFIANGQLFLNTGLPEYSVEDKQVGITLLRAVSYLSRPQLFTRGGGAGPNVEVPGANCLGKARLSYAWAPLPVSRKKSAFASLSGDTVAAAYRLAEIYEGRIWLTPIAPTAAAPVHLISVDNPAIALTACYIEGGNIIVRLLNTTQEPQRTTVNLPAKLFRSASLTSLAGQTSKALTITAGTVYLDFEKNQLLTIQLPPNEPVS